MIGFVRHNIIQGAKRGRTGATSPHVEAAFDRVVAPVHGPASAQSAGAAPSIKAAGGQASAPNADAVNVTPAREEVKASVQSAVLSPIDVMLMSSGD